MDLIKAGVYKDKSIGKWIVWLPIGSSDYSKHRFIKFENAIWFAQDEMKKGSIFSG